MISHSRAVDPLLNEGEYRESAIPVVRLVPCKSGEEGNSFVEVEEYKSIPVL